MNHIAQRFVDRRSVGGEPPHQIKIKDEPPECGARWTRHGIEFADDHLTARISLPIGLDSKRHITVRPATMVVVQSKSVRRCTTSLGFRIMPSDVPPVVVAVQRADSVWQQSPVDPLNHRNRLVTLRLTDGSSTKINLLTERSRLGIPP